MKISFVTPARNEEAYIEATLRAILAQPSHLVKEIIVVDNASTDRTAAVAAAADPRIRVIHQPLPGVAPTKAAGLAVAKGDIVACIDADTIIPPHWAARVVEAFSRQPQLAAVSGPYIFDLDPGGQLLNALFEVVGFVPIHALVNWLGFMAVANGGNVAIRREALVELGDYAEVVRFHGEDAYLIHQIRRFGPVRFSPRFSVQSSDRRIRANGRLQTVSHNTLSWLSVVLFGRPPRIT
jgi:glycosyltransferase involved in cell wall biosynthesis